MTTFQKVIKYLAIAFAIVLIISILTGIINAFAMAIGIFDNDTVSEDVSTYPISNNITSLEVDINAADFTIISGDSFYVKSNLNKLTVEEKNGTLTITENNSFNLGITYTDASLVLCVPKDFVFNHANIKTGAAKLTVEALYADKLDLELGAGEVIINELKALSKAHIEGGAGALSIKSGVLYDLDLDMGVGELNLTASILGESELNYGVGEANLVLIGSKEDFCIEFNKGIGSATIDGETMSDGTVYGNGKNQIYINGGIGAINVSFKDK